jgi:hypothetical protein
MYNQFVKKRESAMTIENQGFQSSDLPAITEEGEYSNSAEVKDIQVSPSYQTSGSNTANKSRPLTARRGGLQVISYYTLVYRICVIGYWYIVFVLLVSYLCSLSFHCTTVFIVTASRGNTLMI